MIFEREIIVYLVSWGVNPHVPTYPALLSSLESSLVAYARKQSSTPMPKELNSESFVNDNKSHETQGNTQNTLTSMR